MIKRFFRVNVSLDVDGIEVTVDEGDRRPIGYYKLLGCSARGYRDFEAQIRRHVDDDIGGRLLDIEDLGADIVDEEMEDLREQIVGDTEREGIWYYSGRSFYLSKDDCEADAEDDEDLSYTPVEVSIAEHARDASEWAGPRTGLKRIHVTQDDDSLRFGSRIKRLISALWQKGAQERK